MDDRQAREEEADADPHDGRDETESERMDRNWNELLQELRVTQTATQILFGFLLAIAFQQRFGDLDRTELLIYLILVSVAALTTALALAPVALHRGLFRQHRKTVTVQTAHVILSCTVAGVGIVLVGTILLIFSVAVGPGPAIWAALAVAAVIVALMLVPSLVNARAAGRPDR